MPVSPTEGKRAITLCAKAVAGLAVAALILVGLEGVLALAGIRPARETLDPTLGFDAGLPLFEQRKDASGIEILSTASNKLRFFNAQSFPRRKAAGATRIVCIGGSTTYGHPYRDSVSFPGWLRELLKAAAPERVWEVINAGGISYASHRELAIVREMLQYEPDIFIVLNGHNEFLEERTYRDLRSRGPLFARAQRLALHTRLYTLLKRAVPAPASVLHREVHTKLDDSVGLDAYRRDDARAARIAAEYRRNLLAMAAAARDTGARVLFVEPVSQLRGCAPFKSEGAAAPEQADIDELREALRRDPRHAGNHFRLAEALVSNGDEAGALPHYRASRDEDIVPLRATQPLIDALREVAADAGIPLLELDRLCADWTQQRGGGRIPGPELFTDHVHFTIEGYRLIALALIERMNELGWLTPPVRVPDETVAAVANRIESAQDTREQGFALRNLAKTLSWAGKSAEAARLAAQALAKLGDDAECHFIQGLYAAEQRDWARAETCYRRALSIEPDFVKARQNLGVALARQGRDEEAMAAYRAVLRLKPDHPNAHYNAALALDRLGRRDEARAHMTRAVALDPKDEEAREILAEWSR
jgi:tetratricopeptide (TPR) repeat protein